MNDRKLRLRVWENLRSGHATDFSEEYRRLERERIEFLADRVRAIVANVRSRAIDAETEHVHDDITTQLVESIGLDCAIMAISRYCDRLAIRAENDNSQCLAFVYRTISNDLWRTTNTLLSGDICDRWRQIQRETK